MDKANIYTVGGTVQAGSFRCWLICSWILIALAVAIASVFSSVSFSIVFVVSSTAPNLILLLLLSLKPYPQQREIARHSFESFQKIWVGWKRWG